MIVVSDTSPLCYLVLIADEHLLPQLFGDVLVPPDVLEELADPRSPQVLRDWLATPPTWLRSQSPTVIDPTLQVDSGEAAAISLALEVQCDALLVDDRKARSAAQARGIVTLDTLTVLEIAAERGLIELPPAVAKLRATNFRISKRMIDQALQRDAARCRRP